MAAVNGGAALDFQAVARLAAAGEEAVEPKICEWCGITFWRPVPATASLGQRECSRCCGRLARLRANAEHAPKYGARLPVAQPEKRGSGRVA